jgi:hypothetical protein
MGHKFSLGQTVIFSPDTGDVLTVAARGTISRLLPKEGAEFQYHVQVGTDGLQRRARESQLRPVTG